MKAATRLRGDAAPLVRRGRGDLGEVGRQGVPAVVALTHRPDRPALQLH